MAAPEQGVTEYASVAEKSGKISTDERRLLEKVAIEAWVAKYRGNGLLGSGRIPGVFVDAQGNPRGDYPLGASFTEQYVNEIVGIIGTLFGAWQESGDLIEQQVITLLEQKAPDCIDAHPSSVSA